ncbi:hypothetical protein EYB26_007857 [Talaromyces marneffei]|uniref:uncharacterized protein n=1 Tax=Talaromyces marneffei TaxID=37727 RepID=UPI0012AA9E7F|nr:uncharacterized protein EYB26_007857 [Talaromyces marneffei]QGA20156.1 hypothetical protein EYB26_007857 [Talaromyces marneffei]
MPDDKQIPGIRTEFKGHYRHTADWDTNYDWKGKRIAIIGNGASGQQLLSNMVKDAGHVDHYVRSKQWILPAFSTNLPTATADAPGGYLFSEDEKTKFELDDEAYLAFRQELESNLHGGLTHFLKGSPENESLREQCTETMLRRLNGDKEWFERLKPDYAPGCKRLTPSPGYLEAVISPKVEYIDQPIVGATGNGLVTADGTVREVDAIIAATGFQNGFLPWFPTIGKNGVDLRERWASDGHIGYPETYFGVMAPDMPNYFAVMQAQTYAVGGTVPLQCETSATYIAKVIRKVQSQGYRAIYPSHEATADFNEIVGNFFDHKVLSDTCTSWLKAEKGKSHILVWWPGTGHHRFAISRDLRWEDFVFERSREARRNRFEYFGDGYTVKEKKGGVENITSYLKAVGKVDLATLHEAWNE